MTGRSCPDLEQAFDPSLYGPPAFRAGAGIPSFTLAGPFRKSDTGLFG